MCQTNVTVLEIPGQVRPPETAMSALSRGMSVTVKGTLGRRQSSSRIGGGGMRGG